MTLCNEGKEVKIPASTFDNKERESKSPPSRTKREAGPAFSQRVVPKNEVPRPFDFAQGRLFAAFEGRVFRMCLARDVS